MKCSVAFQARAARHAEAIERWWRTNRPAAPDLFRAELLSALDLLAGTPLIGLARPYPGVSGLRRIVLRRSGYHVYYVYETERKEVVILAVWGAAREHEPEFG